MEKTIALTRRTSLVAQMIKHLSTMRETRVQSLGWEDPLKNEMAIHSSTLAWKIPWMEELGGLQLQYSCQENPMAGAAWWVAI